MNRPVTPYESEMLELKLRETDPAVIETRSAALRARYGLDPAGLQPVPPIPDAQSGDAGAMAKSAALSYFVPRTVNFGVTPTPQVGITVAAKATVEAWTVTPAETPEVDPVMVGFFRNSGDANSLAFTTYNVGFNDDNAGLDSYIKWTNNTGVSRQVVFVAFAYSKSNTGLSTVKYRIVGGATKTYPALLSATRILYSKPNTGECIGPNLTKLALQRISGLQSEAVTLAYNDFSKLGGYIYSASTQLTLEDGIPGTGKSFILAYTVYNPSGLYDAATYKASQFDQYSCP